MLENHHHGNSKNDNTGICKWALRMGAIVAERDSFG